VDEFVGELVAHGYPPSEIEPMGYHRLKYYAGWVKLMRKADIKAYEDWKRKRGIRD
jgi:hypothetical protein